MRAWLRRLTLLMPLAPTPALAGAWVTSAGDEAIVTAAAGETERGGLGESQVYWEHGIGSGRAVVAKAWAGADRDGGAFLDWRGEALAGVKQRMFAAGPVVFAGQASALAVGAEGRDWAYGGEARLGAGLSLPAGTFVNLEAGSRALEGAAVSALGEFTAGAQRGPWLGYARTGLEDGFAPRWEAAGVYFFQPGWGLQLGARVGGPDDETLLTVGVWRRTRPQ